MPIRIGRLQLELHQRAIHLTREPDPNCADCGGSRGGWMTPGPSWEWDECACLDQLRTWRLPLWPRRTATYSTEPF
jgi:hypothetical protein